MTKILKITSILALLLIMSVATTSAIRTDSIELLTVGETENDERIGGTANLELTIRPGTGKLFINSDPLTQIDTQITTRFAQRIACDHLNIDCSAIDFYYTINADTTLVGGPSAGGAKTLLTVSVLQDNILDERLAATGTINTGGLIGPVAGIPEKINAASEAGISKVFIPVWQSYNASLIANDSDIEIVEVRTLDDMLNNLNINSNINSNNDYEENIPQKYQEIMGEISANLCQNALNLSQRADHNASSRQIDLAINASGQADYYTAASYCFQASVNLRTRLYENQTNETKEELRENLTDRANQLQERIDDEEINNLDKLEAVIVVKERLYEATQAIEDSDNLAFAQERLNSAFSWSKFLDYNQANEIKLNNRFLSQACNVKINELEERINYLEFVAGPSEQRRDELNSVKDISRDKDYPFCIFRATRVKADVNSQLLLQTIDPTNIDDLAITKQEISSRAVYEGDNFPIIAFSYHDYAMNLMSENPQLSAIFFEYATEFGNLDMYIENTNPLFTFSFFEQIDNPSLFLGSSITAFILLLFVIWQLNKKNKRIKQEKGSKPRKISKRNPPGKKR